MTFDEKKQAERVERINERAIQEFGRKLLDDWKSYPWHHTVTLPKAKELST